MSKFNVGDKVISNDSYYLSEEIGTIVGIDTGENPSRKYLVKFDSLDISEGWAYGCFRDISLLIIEPYEGYAIWLDDVIKVEEECEEEKCKEDKHEEDIKIAPPTVPGIPEANSNPARPFFATRSESLGKEYPASTLILL